MSLLEDFKWRHAVKAFDPNQKVSQQNIDAIVEAARLAPTSSGLQPFSIVVIENQKVKEKLVEGALNPDCMKECSHVLVFAGWDNYTPERIDMMYDLTTDVRDLPQGRFSRYTDILKSSFSKKTEEENFVHISQQTYLGLGFALAQAANLKIDSCPIGGFDRKVVDEVLELHKYNLKSVVLMYVGIADVERDWVGKMEKARRATEDFVIEIK